MKINDVNEMNSVDNYWEVSAQNPLGTFSTEDGSSSIFRESV